MDKLENAYQIRCKAFSELSLMELYDIMNIRQKVFIVEQECYYLDADYKDIQSRHLMFYKDGDLLAYTRLVPPDVSYAGDSSIGRVVTAMSIRRSGTGSVLMEKAIEHCRSYWPARTIRISAQAYLRNFYSNLGFKAVGEEYLEDMIPHIEMYLEPSPE